MAPAGPCRAAPAASESGEGTGSDGERARRSPPAATTGGGGNRRQPPHRGTETAPVLTPRRPGQGRPVVREGLAHVNHGAMMAGDRQRPVRQVRGRPRFPPRRRGARGRRAASARRPPPSWQRRAPGVRGPGLRGAALLPPDAEARPRLPVRTSNDSDCDSGGGAGLPVGSTALGGAAGP